MIDDLWQERAPANARTCVHNLVSSLRRTVGRDLLETRGGGYVLVVAATQVDASRFERLLARSRREPSAEKVRLLESALALWRGSPLVDVRYDDLEGEAEPLQERAPMARARSQNEPRSGPRSCCFHEFL